MRVPTTIKRQKFFALKHEEPEDAAYHTLYRYPLFVDFVYE
jgi:hypothetical protein